MKIFLIFSIFFIASSAQELIKLPLKEDRGALGRRLEENIIEFKNDEKNFKNTTVTINKVFQSQFYAEINVGHPGQSMKMRIDTGSYLNWIPSKLCSPYANPSCLVRKLYDSTKSTTYSPLPGNNFSIISDQGELFGYVTKEKFQIGHVHVLNQHFIEVEKMSLMQLFYVGYDGTLGLGVFNDTSNGIVSMVLNLFSQHSSIAPIFSIYINRDETTKKGGSLLFGGVDKRHYNGSFTFVPVIDSYWWSFKINKIVVNYVLPYINKTLEVCSKGCTAIPNSGEIYIAGPDEEIKLINKVISASYVPLLGRYEVSCSSIKKLPHITFVIQLKKFTISPKDYIQKFSYGPLTLCLSAFTKLNYDEKNTWSLGIPFLGQFYTQYDLKLSRVGIANSN